MTQQYYGGDYDPFYRSNPRVTSLHGCSDRHLPYQSYLGRHELRSEQTPRLNTHVIVHESEADSASIARRRIAVAVSVSPFLQTTCRKGFQGKADLRLSAHAAESARSNARETLETVLDV